MFSNVQVKNIRRQTSESQASSQLIKELHLFCEQITSRSLNTVGFEYNVAKLQNIEGFPAAAARKRKKMKNARKMKKMKYDDQDNEDDLKKFNNFASGATGDKSEYDLYKR